MFSRSRARSTRSCKQISASLPEGVEIVHDLRSLGLDLGDAEGVLRDAARRTGRRHPRHDAVPRELRAAVGPIAILLLSDLFTVLPLAAFGQTINLFSLAGLCIAIGAIEDATIVIVENCAAELSRHDRT